MNRDEFQGVCPERIQLELYRAIFSKNSFASTEICENGFLAIFPITGTQMRFSKKIALQRSC